MSAANAGRYAEYKDSGIEWIGKVPKHWQLGRLKDFVCADTSSHVPNRLKDEDLVEFIPMSNVDEILGRVRKFDFVPLKEVSSGYTKFRTSDVIFAKITPCMENGNCAIVGMLTHNICFGSTEFMVFRSRRVLSVKYLHYFLHNDLFRRNAEPFMRGTAGQKRISSHYMATHVFTLPSMLEQISISTYLDTKTAQIDRQMDLLGQKATQYGKLKQSLINETVTRGLDKSVAMKDSRVEWIGQMPEHWRICRLKELGYLYSGLTGKSGDDFSKEKEYGEPFVPFTNIANNFYLSTINLKSVVISPGEKQNFVKIHDLFFLMSSEDYADLGKCSLLTEEMEKKTYLNSFCKGFRFTKRTINPRYVNYLLHSTLYRVALSNKGKGFTRINLRMEKINDIQLLIPSMSEQQAIAAYLDEKTTQIDRIVTAINGQIDKLKDLRKALINDAVTGKIKVVSEG